MSSPRSDSAYLFTLRIKLYRDGPLVIVHAFEGGAEPPNHTRIDIECRMGGKVIFPRGATWCGIPAHESIDGIAARECVLATIAMCPGDTDSDYFASYTKDQLAFAKAHGEALSCEREARYCNPEDGSVKE